MSFALTLLIFGSDLYLEYDQKGRIQTNSVADPGSGILLDPWFQDPGWEKNQYPDQDKHPESYFRELRNIFLCVKILNFFDADLGSGIFLDPGAGMEKFGSGIRDKHTGSAMGSGICFLSWIRDGKIRIRDPR